MAKDTIVVHWEAAPPREPHSRCAGQVAEIRQYHLTHGYNDIAYSFIVCNHGQVFTGRGWGSSAATCGTAWNSRADSVCWMGGPGYTPTQAAYDAIRSVIVQAQARGMWQVLGHRDCCSTQCPGDDLWRWVHAGFPGGTSPPPAEEDDLPYDQKTLSLIMSGAVIDALKAVADAPDDGSKPKEETIKNAIRSYVVQAMLTPEGQEAIRAASH